MSPVEIPGVLRKQDKLFTENPLSCRGISVYNEQLVTIEDREYRSWNPYRSKLAAAFLKGVTRVRLSPDMYVLYLGAATGTTVSHLSDIVRNGLISAVEVSPIAMKSLLRVSEQRPNIIPILADANHPERYQMIVPSVDLLYQDIAQRNQTEIFTKNMHQYLKRTGQGVLMVKARSVDVSLKPKKVYETVAHELQNQGAHVLEIVDLSPFEKDHAALVISW